MPINTVHVTFTLHADRFGLMAIVFSDVQGDCLLVRTQEAREYGSDSTISLSAARTFSLRTTSPTQFPNKAENSVSRSRGVKIVKLS